MKYVAWLWRNSRGIRWNMAVRIVTGITQVALGLLMVWLSRLFIDETIRTVEADDVLRMVCWLGGGRRGPATTLFLHDHDGGHPTDEHAPTAYLQ